MKRVALLLAVLLSALVHAAPAAAQLKLCNRTSYVLYAATGYVQGIDAVTRGWTRIVPGACQLAIREKLGARGYFVYARTSLAHSGISRAWGGTQKLCVKDAAFSLSVALAAVRCPSDDTFDLPFAGIDTQRKSSWSMTFDDPSAYASLKEAEAAGIKRLLKDQGAKLGAVDAKPDKASDAALAAFRKRLNMTATATTADLFDALETEALKTSAPSGYQVCNDTTKPVWVAVGEKIGDKWVSRGWWKIAAGGCAKTIADALHADRIYVLAQAGGTQVVAGPARFCTTNVEFEIQGRQNCKARGLSEAGFAETDTRGMAGFTAHIGEHGLVAPPKPGR